ncbi:hypothetical protein [Enterococcus faecalis]|uniref:hypothetical protein n=1 Tax=Enterococcus faecalis TaxID=1351 RepID=UPI003DA06295
MPRYLLLVQWRSDDEELTDIYYMSIRLGAEKRAEELGYNILKVSQLEQHFELQQSTFKGLMAFWQYS